MRCRAEPHGRLIGHDTCRVGFVWPLPPCDPSPYDAQVHDGMPVLIEPENAEVGAQRPRPRRCSCCAATLARWWRGRSTATSRLRKNATAASRDNRAGNRVPLRVKDCRSSSRPAASSMRKRQDMRPTTSWQRRSPSRSGAAVAWLWLAEIGMRSSLPRRRRSSRIPFLAVSSSGLDHRRCWQGCRGAETGTGLHCTLRRPLGQCCRALGAHMLTWKQRCSASAAHRSSRRSGFCSCALFDAARLGLRTRRCESISRIGGKRRGGSR